MPSYGVNIDDEEMADWIESQRIRTSDSGGNEVVSRSQVIREAVALDRAITDLLDDPPSDLAAQAHLPPRDGNRRGWARQLVLDALRYRAMSDR